MFGKVFVICLSFITLTEAAGNCFDAAGTAAPCVLVPGCNFPDNGTLTPLATQCSNDRPDSDCEALFPCSATVATSPAHPTNCIRPGTAATTPGDQDTFPYVRAESCLNPSVRDIALQCAKTCALCCESPEYNCDDDNRSPIDCQLNRNKCNDASWTDIMSQYCPMTCGLCTSGTCTDVNSGCNTMTALCKHIDFVDYMRANCARTCDYCTTTSTTCSNIASNCAANANLCTNAIYRDLMMQQCCATCSGTSLSGSSSISTCSDSDSSCSNWVRNGFCSNSFYTTAQKRQYCARSCNLC